MKIPGGSFDADGHIYRDCEGRRVLSVTQVFAMLGLANFDRVPASVLERKRDIGIAVHSAIELLVADALNWDTVDEDAMAYVVAFERWLRQMGFVVAAAEEQGIHRVSGMAYGYRVDLRGTMFYQGEMRHVIVDVKTTVATSPSWAVQTAAYALAAPPLGAGVRYLRMACHLASDGTAKTLIYEDPKDEMSFLYMLYCAIWKLNAGYTLEAA